MVQVFIALLLPIFMGIILSLHVYLLVKLYRRNSKIQSKFFNAYIGVLWGLTIAAMIFEVQYWYGSFILQFYTWAAGLIVLLVIHKTRLKYSISSTLSVFAIATLATPLGWIMFSEISGYLISPLTRFLRFIVG